jgi:hypothetical protein
MTKLIIANNKPEDDESSIAARVEYDNLIAHELASLMDLIEGRAFEDLKADIAKQGILQPIVLYEGKILDGRNRYRAAKAVGHKFVGANFEVFDGDLAAAEAFVFSVNAQRRQMTNAQKVVVIERLIRKYPDDSNRKIAARSGFTSHSQVASVRERMENPPERREFEKFCKTFDNLEDRYRVEFAKKFAADLRELLAS